MSSTAHPASITTLHAALSTILAPDQLHTEHLDAWGGDGTTAFALPDLVVEPATSEQVTAIVRLAVEHDVPIITRGAGTGLAGGAVPAGGGLVISTARMDQIIEIDAAAMTITVEAGVRTGDLQAAVEARGLFYPPDPASLATCTIGGNVACNAGGPRALKYGVTRTYVLGLTVVLADGEIVRLGGKTHKQASGYSLLQLFVGSEGTLGIITEITLRLLPLPPARATLTALFPTLDAASEAVTAVLHSGILPCTIELIDQVTLRAIENHLHLGLPHHAGAMLLIENDGTDPTSIMAELALVQQACARHRGFAIDVATAAEDRARLWRARRSVHYALRAAAPTCWSGDVVVPRSHIPQFVRRVEAIMADSELTISVAGHAGDGNLHPTIMFDASDPAQLTRAQRAETLITRAAVDLGGMVSGEHGVGLLKRAYLEAAIGSAPVAMMRSIKHALDPHNLFNPGKIISDQR